MVGSTYGFTCRPNRVTRFIRKSSIENKLGS